MKGATIATIIVLAVAAVLLLIRKKRAKEIKDEMVLDIIHAMDDFESAYPHLSEAVGPIFLNSIKFVGMQSLRTLRKSMANNNVNTEMGAMNMVHNFALMELTTEVSATDYLISTKELVPKRAALELYNFINDAKYHNNFITYTQYIDNQKLGEKFCPDEDCGRWQ